MAIAGRRTEETRQHSRPGTARRTEGAGGSDQKRPVSPRRDRSGQRGRRSTRRRRRPTGKMPRRHPFERSISPRRKGRRSRDETRRLERQHEHEKAIQRHRSGNLDRGRRGGERTALDDFAVVLDTTRLGRGPRAAARSFIGGMRIPEARRLETAVLRRRQPEGQQRQHREAAKPRHALKRAQCFRVVNARARTADRPRRDTAAPVGRSPRTTRNAFPGAATRLPQEKSTARG